MSACKQLGRCLLLLAFTSHVSQLRAQLKDWGNRFEGTADRTNGNPAYELLGFYACRESFPMNRGVRLRMRFYLPDAVQASIEAREIKVEHQYSMQPKPE